MREHSGAMPARPPSRRLIRGVAALGVLALVGVSATPAGATSTSASVSASASTNLGTPGGNGSQAQNNPAQSTATLRFDSVGTGDAASASAHAFSAVGYLAVSANTSAGVTAAIKDSQGNLDIALDGGDGRAEARASWSDMIHVSAPGYGGGGYLIAHLLIHGSVSATTTVGSTFISSGNPDGSHAYFDDSAFAALIVTGNGVNGSGFDADCAAVGLSNRIACANRNSVKITGAADPDYSLGSVHDLTITIPLDGSGSTLLNYQLVADSGADAVGAYYKQSGSAAGQGVVDVSHSLIWGGVAGLYDASGNPISDMSITSDSGFNYLNSAAPEPGLWVLMTASVAGIGAALRSRRRRLRA